MNIETSISISTYRREKVIDAACKLHVPVRIILAVLMRKTRLIYSKSRAELWKTVDYQDSSPGMKYDIWHVSLDPRCYEFGVSERLLFKVSVSKIFAVAIDMFLNEIIDHGIDVKLCSQDEATNYLLASYQIDYCLKKNNEIWRIIWDKRVREKNKRRKRWKQL